MQINAAVSEIQQLEKVGHGTSTLRGRETVHLKLRAYTGHDTQVLWACLGLSTPANLFCLLFYYQGLLERFRL